MPKIANQERIGRDIIEKKERKYHGREEKERAILIINENAKTKSRNVPSW